LPVSQNVTDIPVVTKTVPIQIEDLPLNEQPVLPLADNYEFQAKSVPAPNQSQQKPVIPTPQVVTERDVQKAFEH